ncbi:TetR/AcrR family transcriptional regulator [Alkalihalobacillus sp. AL-G]|uniref:TetR/AcrR family transcriptional regulator n=1 Tax=Alkalihalobacillus sp. AL-G TaxID=2926399 RepID=UPI00272D4D8A|nr:TetR/AcrR family transcriptional regulator [Alkalihalobacillus sp. AL-G]WLD95444.1 TetR/AcrR family transcriptional regulator [Alkalihalobacillus sp. AL-G]
MELSPKVSEEHKQERRSDLLNAAKQVFTENGYEKTTMKHVMNKAKVSRGGLYFYFSNKEDLFEAVLDEELKENLKEVHELIESSNECWPLLKLLIKGDEDEPPTEPLAENLGPVIIEFFITGRNDSRRIQYAKERYENAFQFFRPIIEKGIRSGEFSPKAPTDIIISTILTFSDGLCIFKILLKDHTLQSDEQADLFLDYLRYILQVKDS